MARLAFDPANCQLLCIPCHIKVHQQMRTHTKAEVQANKQRARQRFMAANDPNYKPDDLEVSKEIPDTDLRGV